MCENQAFFTSYHGFSHTMPLNCMDLYIFMRIRQPRSQDLFPSLGAGKRSWERGWRIRASAFNDQSIFNIIISSRPPNSVLQNNTMRCLIFPLIRRERTEGHSQSLFGSRESDVFSLVSKSISSIFPVAFSPPQQNLPHLARAYSQTST